MIRDGSHFFFAESRLRYQNSPCEICGVRSGTGAGFSARTSVSPCQYLSTVLHNHLYLHVALPRRTDGRNPGSCQTQFSFVLERYFLSVCKRPVSWAQAVSQLPLTVEDRVRSQGSPREVCGGHVALGLDWISPSTFGSPRQYHSNSAQYSSLSISCSYWKVERKKTKKLSKGQWSFTNRIALGRNVLYPIFKCSGSRSRDARHNSTLQNKRRLQELVQKMATLIPAEHSDCRCWWPSAIK